MLIPNLGELCQGAMPFDHSIEARVTPHTNLPLTGPLNDLRFSVKIRADILVRGWSITAYDDEGNKTLNFFVNFVNSKRESRWCITDARGGSTVPAWLLFGRSGETFWFPAPRLLRQGEYATLILTVPTGLTLRYVNVTLVALALQTDSEGRTDDPLRAWDRLDLGYQAFMFNPIDMESAPETGSPGNEHDTDFPVGAVPFDMVVTDPRTLHVDADPENTNLAIPLVGGESILQFRDSSFGKNLNIRRAHTSMYECVSAQAGVNLATVVPPGGGQLGACWHVRNSTSLEMFVTPLAPASQHPVRFYCLFHGERIPVQGLPHSFHDAKRAQELQNQLEAAGSPLIGGAAIEAENILRQMLQRTGQGL